MINKSDFELAQTAVDKILSESVDNIEIKDIPPLDELSDSNQVSRGKLSILFVDMRKSSELTEDLGCKKMVKIYRAFIRLIIQAIRYSGGYSRQFAGDGIMGVFQDTTDEETTTKQLSSDKAIRAARYIITLIDYCLNPLLENYIKDISIACGVGICTGDILITKAGMRGKEGDDTSENEMGIVWVGSTTNNASRYCSLANGGEIFIDKNTLDESNEDTVNWQTVSRAKGIKVFKGYIAKDYYLELDKDITNEAIRAEIGDNKENTFVQHIFDDITGESKKFIEEISKKSQEVIKKLCELAEREEKIRKKEDTLVAKQKLISTLNEMSKKQEKQNKIDEYNLNIKIIKSAHCKRHFAIGMEKDFWNAQIVRVVRLGKEIDKDEIEVKSEICYALVSIYEDLSMYEEAYECLCIQAQYYSWIHDRTVRDITNKSGMYTKLKRIIEGRLKTPVKPELRIQLEECLKVLNPKGKLPRLGLESRN